MRDGKFVVLCVDDDPDILATLRMVLEANGYRMVGAQSAAEAMVRFEEEQPDLVIVDLMMEQVDTGTTVVKQLREKGAHVPMYLLSSVGDELAEMVDTVALGLSGVFQKPLEPRFLLRTLEAKLASP
jgi:DNA-binding response OmpR family regulator